MEGLYFNDLVSLIEFSIVFGYLVFLFRFFQGRSRSRRIQQKYVAIKKVLQERQRTLLVIQNLAAHRYEYFDGKAAKKLLAVQNTLSDIDSLTRIAYDSLKKGALLTAETLLDSLDSNRQDKHDSRKQELKIQSSFERWEQETQKALEEILQVRSHIEKSSVKLIRIANTQ